MYEWGCWELTQLTQLTFPPNPTSGTSWPGPAIAPTILYGLTGKEQPRTPLNPGLSSAGSGYGASPPCHVQSASSHMLNARWVRATSGHLSFSLR